MKCPYRIDEVQICHDGKTWGDGIFAIHVKWWMHIPAPPKEKERKDGDGNV